LVILKKKGVLFVAKNKVGTDRPDDYKRFSGLDKGYDIKFGGVPATPQTAKKKNKE
jgi:hypothetical protein